MLDIRAPGPSPLPSVDLLLHLPAVEALIERHGRSATIASLRVALDRHRACWQADGTPVPPVDELTAEVARHLDQRSRPLLRRVFNLTGTVLHTNLGRALLSEAAVAATAAAMREPSALEFDLASGGRGERDALVEPILTELTGAEAATVVNNNAAAVLLVLAALAGEREVIVSRGELVEIGGAFRIPDVMRSAGARLVEVGTTNRTHKRDYAGAIGAATAALMKVHASNYKVVGFTAEVDEADLAGVAHAHDLPLIVDLGAGSLVDLGAFGLPREPVVRDTVAAGADVVTFSGDKLLGGPQAGLIVGRRALIDRVRRHPLKRALRASKMTIAALEATLLAYRAPERMVSDLPTLRLLTRPVHEIEAGARRVLPAIATWLGDEWVVEVTPVSSQVGSGSLPVDVLPSMAVACRPRERKAGGALGAAAERLRRLPVPVIGRIADGQLLLDLRCLEDEAGFVAQLAGGTPT